MLSWGNAAAMCRCNRLCPQPPSKAAMHKRAWLQPIVAYDRPQYGAFGIIQHVYIECIQHSAVAINTNTVLFRHIQPRLAMLSHAQPPTLTATTPKCACRLHKFSSELLPPVFQLASERHAAANGPRCVDEQGRCKREATSAVLPRFPPEGRDELLGLHAPGATPWSLVRVPAFR